ncbi:MAG: NlpC/P60 family protein [Actinomycetota bacterium]
MGKRLRVLVALFVVPAGLFAIVPARAAAVEYSDVSSSHWADSAIRYVAESNDWMRVGGREFGPDRALTRALLARMVVRAFYRPPAPPPSPPPSPSPDPSPSPEPSVDPSPAPSPDPTPISEPSPTPTPTVAPEPALEFHDVPETNWVYGYANRAVLQGWMSAPGGYFRPGGLVTKTEMDRTLVRALWPIDAIRGITGIATADGYRFRHSSTLAYGVIAAQLGFHYNYPNAMGRELVPGTVVTRADGAYALREARRSGGTLVGETLPWELRPYELVQVTSMDSVRRQVVEFALRYANYPYVWGGSSSKGFDCSGFVWWVLRSGSGPSSRGYSGWSLPQRTSYDMAHATSRKIDLAHLRPLDILFWDVEGPNDHTWQGVGHAGVYLGNGWFIHSSGSRGGVSIGWMGEGWWRDAFVWGRRIVPT